MSHVLKDAPRTATGAVPLLQANGISAGYNRRQVLYDVSVTVAPGEIVTVLGHNGAGKTTLLKTIVGFVPVTAGVVRFAGEDRSGEDYTARVRDGISFTPAEAPVFRDLPVRDNLELGGFIVPDRAERAERIERVMTIFPILRERAAQLAGMMSGGQQRMLSLGMAMMAKPRLMLLDEPSLGLSPAVVQTIFSTIRQLAVEDGLSVLVVEQNVRAALRIADRAYFMRAGKIILEEDSATALARGNWWDLF